MPPGEKMTSANRWRVDALLQCRCSDIGAMHRNATGQCGLVILPWSGPGEHQLGGVRTVRRLHRDGRAVRGELFCGLG